MDVLVQHGHQPGGQANLVVQQRREQVRGRVVLLAVFVSYGLRDVQATL